MTTDLFLVADQALTAKERGDFLAKFPRHRGGHVADILTMLDDTDAHLDVVEPLYEEHGVEVPEPHLLSVACYLCLGINGSASWELVKPMVARIRERIALAQAM